MLAEGRPRTARLGPLLLESSRRPPGAGTGGTLGHLSAPSRVKPLALYLDRMAQVPALGQSRLCSATPSAEKPTLPQDVPSTLVHRSPGRSTQDRRTDSDFPSGEPPGSVLGTTIPTRPGGQPALGPPCRSPPSGDLPPFPRSAAESSSWGSLRSPGAARGPPPHPRALSA